LSEINFKGFSGCITVALIIARLLKFFVKVPTCVIFVTGPFSTIFFVSVREKN
jgi:hypothetical protein